VSCIREIAYRPGPFKERQVLFRHEWSSSNTASGWGYDSSRKGKRCSAAGFVNSLSYEMHCPREAVVTESADTIAVMIRSNVRIRSIRRATQ
jgi:hypothetical protein